MTKSRLLTQKESDARRGVKVASYKFPLEFIEQLKQLSEQTGKSRNVILMEAVELWAKQNNL